MTPQSSQELYQAYIRHRDNGDTELALKAWREFWDKTAEEMAEKDNREAA